MNIAPCLHLRRVRRKNRIRSSCGHHRPAFHLAQTMDGPPQAADARARRGRVGGTIRLACFDRRFRPRALRRECSTVHHDPLTRHPPARTAILWAPDDAVRDTSMAAGMALCTRSIPNGTSTYANFNAMIESHVVVSPTTPDSITSTTFRKPQVAKDLRD